MNSKTLLKTLPEMGYKILSSPRFELEHPSNSGWDAGSSALPLASQFPLIKLG